MSGLHFNDSTVEPAIVFSVSTMRIIRVGDKSYIQPYYQQMLASLQDITSAQRKIMLEGAKALGLGAEDMEEVVVGMQNDLQYLEIPKDESLLSQLETQAGLRDYLIKIGRLIDMDKEGELQTQIRKQFKH